MAAAPRDGYPAGSRLRWLRSAQCRKRAPRQNRNAPSRGRQKALWRRALRSMGQQSETDVMPKKKKPARPATPAEKAEPRPKAKAEMIVDPVTGRVTIPVNDAAENWMARGRLEQLRKRGWEGTVFEYVEEYDRLGGDPLEQTPPITRPLTPQ